MGKHWNRRGRAARARAARAAGRPRMRRLSLHEAAAACAAEAAGVGAVAAERDLASSCASKRAYGTLAQAADAKRLFDSIYTEESHVYRCHLCGMFHLSRKEGGRGAVADRFLPPARAGRRPGLFCDRLATALAAAGLDAAWLAHALGVDEGEVASWLGGDPRGVFRAPEVAAALGVAVEDLL